jgi:hypothetical protein
MSISCPSLPLSLFEDILKIDTKYDESLRKIQSDIMLMGNKLKDNSKELEIIHKLFISLNERVNHTTKREIYFDNTSIKEYTNNLEQRIMELNERLNKVESNLLSEIEKSKQDFKDFLTEKTEEIHSRLLKNLVFINEQQLKALKNEILRPIPPISPVISPTNIQCKVSPIVEEQWTKVDKKNYKPK